MLLATVVLLCIVLVFLNPPQQKRQQLNSYPELQKRIERLTRYAQQLRSELDSIANNIEMQDSIVLSVKYLDARLSRLENILNIEGM